MIQIIFRSSIILLLFYVSSCKQKKIQQRYEWHGYTMGTRYQIKICKDVIPKDKLFRIKQNIHDALAEVNRQMSPFEKESEISKFNQFSTVTPFKTSPEFVKVVKKSIELYNNTNGAFDITVAPLINLWGFGTTGYHEKIPPENKINSLLKQIGSDKLTIIDSITIKKNIPELIINLSAIAKGYGVDVAADIIQKAGYRNYMVEVGGEVSAHGVNSRGETWRIGIDKPDYGSLPGAEIEGIIALKDVSVATSGDYRNFFKIGNQYFSHTIDPRTGRPVTHNLASVTVIAKTCMEADGIATAVMVLGKGKGLKWVENLHEVEALLIVRNHDNSFSEFQTTGFKNYLISK